MKNCKIEIQMICPRCGYWQFASADEYDMSLTAKRLRCPMGTCHSQELLPSGSCRVSHFPEHGYGFVIDAPVAKRGLLGWLRREKKVLPPVYFGLNPNMPIEHPLAEDPVENEDTLPTPYMLDEAEPAEPKDYFDDLDEVETSPETAPLEDISEISDPSLNEPKSSMKTGILRNAVSKFRRKEVE